MMLLRRKPGQFLFNCLLCYVQPYSWGSEGILIWRSH